ncbi:MAG: peptidase [Pseudomonas sp. PGPPP4]|uniref:PepSY domain-containing protein n=1 Tax=Pseudomonas sp. PGPPP4 TaxID=2015556 RepID=UPI000BD9E1BE|nr:PepSY domain-containing protein [Pseudomonas sp. PGPPP4]OYT84475.1 MAG: peptidase [Pseudomonas sp. PGPPP4]
MKSKLLASLFACSVLASTAALANQPGADWMPMNDVKSKLMEQGYTSITKIEADDGQWEGEGMKKDGMKYDFHADAKTGKITKEKMDM